MAYNIVKLEDVSWKETHRPVDPGHVKELAASIREVGLLEAIDVVDLGGGKFLGIAGRHRFEAVKSLGEATIDAHVLDVDEEGQRIARFHENAKRRDLDPIQRARAIRDYLDFRRAKDPSVTQDDVAKELQVSPAELSNTLLLLRQEVHVQKLVEDGQLAPGHIEHAVAPLRAKLEDTAKAYGYPEKEAAKWAEELTVRFAHDAAKERLDVRTAKDDAGDFYSRAKGQLEKARLEEVVKKAKVKRCPGCREDSYNATPAGFQEIGGRVVLLDGKVQYGRGHKWFADSGEFYLTPGEKKEAERQAAQEAKQRKAVRKEAAKGRKDEPATVREYAVAFLRAPIEKWAKALQEAAVGAGGSVSGIVVDPLRVTMESKKIPVAHKSKDDFAGLDVPVFLSPVEVPDGNGGTFLTRAQIGAFASSSYQDNVVEEPEDVKLVRKMKAELLAFQQMAIGTKQGENEMMPANLGGFLLGERVTIAQADTVSYNGKTGAILAFDVETEVRMTKWDHRPVLDEEPAIRGGKSLLAVLNFALAGKRHKVSALGKLTRWSCAKCAGKAVVQVLDGKDGRICVDCGKPEKTCSCEKKGKAPKGRGK